MPVHPTPAHPGARGLARLLARLSARLAALARQPRRILWWCAAAALAAVTASTVAGLTRDAEAAMARYGETRPALVALDDLPAGAPVDPAAVRVEERPAGLLPDDALAELPAAAVARVEIAAGEVLLARRVDPDGASPLAAALPSGTRGVAVPRTDTTPELTPGDRVDLFLAPVGSDTGAPASVLATGAAVLTTTELTVVLAVPAADAGAVTAAAGTGLVGLALVPAAG